MRHRPHLHPFIFSQTTLAIATLLIKLPLPIVESPLLSLLKLSLASLDPFAVLATLCQA